MKLGRLPSPPEKLATTLKLARYLPNLAHPDAVDLTVGIPSWPMFANDHYGDCTCASLGHMLEVFTMQVDGKPRILTDNDILALYNLVNNGVDQGADMLRVLGTWRKVGLAGDLIFAYCAVPPSNLELVKAGLWYFSGLYIGLNLPLTAQVQTGQGLWAVVPGGGPHSAPGSWGGHAVNVVAYDAVGPTVVTWGALQKMTWEFWNTYVDECYAVVPADYDRLQGKPLANGFKEDELMSDLVQFGPVNG